MTITAIARRDTPQAAMKAKFEQCGLPYKQIEVYGAQIVVTAWSRKAAERWADLIAKFATVRGVIESIDYNAENTNTVMLPSSHKVWRVFARC